MVTVKDRVCDSALFKSFSTIGTISSELHKKQIDLLSKFTGGSVDLVKNNNSGIALLTLNNPEKKNALTGSMMLEFEKRVDELQNWSEGCGVILSGSNNTFSSGADLELIKALINGKESGHPGLMASFMQNLLTKLLNLPLISVALVEGAALGGGTELMTACDFRIISSNTNIGFVQAKMGLSPGWGGGIRLVNLLGRSKALHLLSSAKSMKGHEAHEIGLADEVFGEFEDPLEVATTFLSKHIKASPEVIQSIKQVVANASKSDFDSIESLNFKEKLIFENLFGGKANLEALNRKSKF